MANEEARARADLPEERIHRLVSPLVRFMHVEAAGGIVLLALTVTALALANSPFSEDFLALWKTKIGFSWGEFEMRYSLKHWINDGLMGIGFTMSIFIAGLGLTGASLDAAKIGILTGSVISGVLGVGLLYALLPKPDAAA